MAAPVEFDDRVDLLDELRIHGDATYAMKSKNFPVYKGPYALPSGRTPQKLLEDTLASDRVRLAIDTVSIDRGWSKQATEKAARLILIEMAQSFDLKSVRPLAYVAKKVVPRLFSHVYVNRERFVALRKLSEESSIIFMPSHRTYMDFILLQFLCFHFEINLPAIAAAADFLNMKFMGEALRRCGAFFIRRKFGDDKLYWAIFTEYVENQLKHADRPMEFFIEGTRSRTGKSLHPKYGLLSVLLGPYFRNEVYDFHVVPISFSFGRFLEESLYAYELLGFPKPKESTSGLWKARSVLSMDFGDVFVHVAEPISVRDYFTKVERPINRSVHALRPMFLFEYTHEEQMAIRRLGHHVVKTNERHAVVRVWSLACIVLSRMFGKPGRFENSKLLYSEFLQNLSRLFDLTHRLQHHAQLHTNSFQDEVDYSFRLHSNMIERVGDHISLKPVSVNVIDTGSAVIPGKIVDAAVPRLMISNYGNQAMHLFANLSFVGLSILKNNGHSSLDAIYGDYLFLQTLFSREFISVPGEERRSFEKAVSRLDKAGLLNSEPGEHSINPNLSIRSGPGVCELASIMEVFLRGYHICYDMLSAPETIKDGTDERHFAILVQKSVSDMLQSGKLSMFELLSGDLIKNSLHALPELGAVRKVHGATTRFCPKIPEINLVREKLGSFIFALDAGEGGNFGKSKL